MAALYGKTDGLQLHVVLVIGDEELKIVWRTPLWYTVMEWVNGVAALGRKAA